MTLVAMVTVAPLVGLLVGMRRSVFIMTIAIFVVMLVFQTIRLGMGWGVNPPETIRDPVYWLVQPVFLALGLGLAWVTAKLHAWIAAKRDSRRASPR